MSSPRPRREAAGQRSVRALLVRLTAPAAGSRARPLLSMHLGEWSAPATRRCLSRHETASLYASVFSGGRLRSGGLGQRHLGERRLGSPFARWACSSPGFSLAAPATCL